MLEALSIQGIVLIDQLELKFDSGFTVLTGETGAGKSILLDALGLVLGERGQVQLINPRHQSAQVTAVFTLGQTHPVWLIMQEHNLPIDDSTLILRRTLTSDGKSRAFVNDQIVTLNLLKEIGCELVEIHGQFDHLLNPKSHLHALDKFASLNDDNLQVQVQVNFKTWSAAQKILKDALENRDKILQDQEFMQYAVTELSDLNLQDNEESTLKLERDFLANHSKIIEQLQLVNQKLYCEAGADTLLREASKHARKIADMASTQFEPLYSGLDRACIELEEIRQIIDQNLEHGDNEENRLEAVEQRLHKLRAMARKYNITVNELPTLLNQFQESLTLTTSSSQHLEKLQTQVIQTRQAFLDSAMQLRIQRQQAGQNFATAIKQELMPLKLDKAEVRVCIDELAESAWSTTGIDHVEFKIQPNPGLPLGPLTKIASGGERSRFMLALKVILANIADRSLLIFDEIDAGVGGAVATAIGDRMAKLGDQTQVLAITHAPQVAACADNHFVVAKHTEDNHTITNVKILCANDRLEEIARMLAGELITPEARAAAGQLLNQYH